MFQSTLSALIDDAVMDCLAYGCGRASINTNGTMIDVVANWAENEADIEITIKENHIVRFTFTERVPAEYR